MLIQLLVKALPIEEGDYLRIIWPITPSIQFYKEGPCHYLSHLIGHEGEGSIFHIIKELGKFTSTFDCCPYTFAALSSTYSLSSLLSNISTFTTSEMSKFCYCRMGHELDGWREH